MTDPMRGTDLPPVPPTAPPGIPVGEQRSDGKHVAHDLGPLVAPDGTVIPPTAPGDPLTNAEAAHQPTPLALQAQTLADEVKALREAATALSSRTTRHGWLLVLTAIGLTLDIALSIVAFVILHTQSVNNNQLQAQQVQITAQQQRADITRRDALCPVFSLVLTGDTPIARSNDPAGPAAHDALIAAIHHGSTALQCGTP